MIDLQHVVLYVSSFVILFHRGRKKAGGGKTGKSEEKARKSTGLKRQKRAGTHEWQAPGQEKTAGTPRNRQGENRIMQSCERAVFSPCFLVPLYKTGRRFYMGDVLTA